MLKEAQGNLLQANAEALVNTVNCDGFMGKGIALQFKQAWPDNFKAYAKACKSGEVRLGSDAVQAVQGWNDRKQRLFREDHIRIAHQRLQQHGWILS
jgi:O-acetyl-ADP-ribose deacetylase (regulator of RNase III)